MLLNTKFPEKNTKPPPGSGLPPVVGDGLPILGHMVDAARRTDHLMFLEDEAGPVIFGDFSCAAAGCRSIGP